MTQNPFPSWSLAKQLRRSPREKGQKMRVGWYVRSEPAHEVIGVGEVPTSTPGRGEVLVRLHASSIIVAYGAAREPTTAFPLSPRPARNMSLHFIYVYMMADSAKDAACTDIARAIADNALRHRIANIIPLDELARVHTEAEKQSGTGHMVVEIP